MRLFTVFLLVLLGLQYVSWAQDSGRIWVVHNRLRFEYDDNIFLTEDDEESSFKIIDQLELHVNFDLQSTFASIRFRPSLVWWENRPDSELDFNQDLDFVLNHTFTPRLSLNVNDTLRASELEEIVNRAVQARNQERNLYNSLNGDLNFALSPRTTVSGSGRYTFLRYTDNDDVADREDYDIYVAGLSVNTRIANSTTVGGDVRYEITEYELDDRDAEGVQVAGTMNHTFSPDLLANARVGWTQRSFPNSDQDDQSSPSVEGSLTVLPTPATRISAGGSYTILEANVFPFNNQQQAKLFASLAHDITARLSWFLSTSLSFSEYDAGDDVPEALDPDTVADGNEDTYQLSTRLLYKLNRSNWVEASWQFTDFTSDIREEYSRNRIGVGWKTRL